MIPYSPYIRVENLLYISGQIGINPETLSLSNSNFEMEARQVMNNLQTQLSSNGLTLNDLVSTIIYLTDMKNYTLLNEVYGSYFNDKYPTRTCIAVAELPAKASVEISGIAHFKNENKI